MFGGNGLLRALVVALSSGRGRFGGCVQANGRPQARAGPGARIGARRGEVRATS
jgi:hypothetical protein